MLRHCRFVPGARTPYAFTGGWVGPRIGLDGCGKSRIPIGIRSPDRPARSELLYRLSYPGPRKTEVLGENVCLALLFPP